MKYLLKLYRLFLGNTKETNSMQNQIVGELEESNYSQLVEIKTYHVFGECSYVMDISFAARTFLGTDVKRIEVKEGDEKPYCLVTYREVLFSFDTQGEALKKVIELKSKDSTKVYEMS